MKLFEQITVTPLPEAIDALQKEVSLLRIPPLGKDRHEWVAEGWPEWFK